MRLIALVLLILGGCANRAESDAQTSKLAGRQVIIRHYGTLNSDPLHVFTIDMDDGRVTSGTEFCSKHELGESIGNVRSDVIAAAIASLPQHSFKAERRHMHDGTRIVIEVRDGAVTRTADMSNVLPAAMIPLLVAVEDLTSASREDTYTTCRLFHEGFHLVVDELATHENINYQIIVEGD